METSPKLRILCLHGFRTSAAIFEKQIRRWDPSILNLLDLVFLDGPFPTEISDVADIFPPPYFQWFQFNKIYTEFVGMEECWRYISDFVSKNGPFDGFMGFSQGAVLSAAFAGLQQKGLVLTDQPPLRFIISISGAMFKNKQLMEDCYSEVIKCPSVHLIGANDWLKPKNEELLAIFENPVVIRHEAKHIVPRLGAEATITLRDFLMQFIQPADTGLGSTVAAGTSEKTEELPSEIEVAV